MTTTSEDVRAAADYIKEHGWVRDRLYSGEAACILGALCRATYLSGPGIAYARYVAARAAVLRRVIQHYPGSGGYYGGIPYYNDIIAKDQEEVLEFLEKVAIDLEGEGK